MNIYKLKYQYETKFKYLIGYFFIIVSAILAFLSIYALFLYPSQWTGPVISLIGSVVFYLSGTRYIKIQNMTNEMHITLNILYYLRKHLDLTKTSIEEIISIMFFSDVVKTIITNKSLYESLYWRVESNKIICNEYVLTQIKDYIKKTENDNNYTILEDAFLSEKILKNVEYIDVVIELIKKDQLKTIPINIKLDIDHSFVMTDYYKKVENGK